MKTKTPVVRHWRNGPGIDVCLGCGARGESNLVFAPTMKMVTCPQAKAIVDKRDRLDPKFAIKMAKVRKGKAAHDAVRFR